MTKAKKKRFSFHEEEDLKRGSDAAEVEALQSLLVAFGHLRGTYMPGHLCGCTERAVRRYQRFYGLESDGIVGPVTKKHMVQPRCSPMGKASAFFKSALAYPVASSVRVKRLGSSPR